MSARFLTTGEIGRYCGVHFRTVIRWIEQGRLKAHRLPGARGDNRVRVEDFLEFLSANDLPIPAELQPHRRRVLVVDDDANVARGIDRTLRSAGFETAVAVDGLQAGVALKSFHPAVMTLDLRMPGLDGYEVLRFIRSDPQLQSLRIVVVSGVSQPELERAVEEGADDAVAKPFEPDDLVARIAKLAGVPAPASSKE